jgi:nitroreductase
MTNEVLEAMKLRRSIRAYKPDQITDEELDTVLEAGTYAATGMNKQSPKMVVVQDKEARDLLSRLNAQVMGIDSDPFYGAPTIVVVFADKTRNTYIEDGSLVIGNMLLAAYSIGLGSCWIHRAREVFSGPEGKALMNKWDISENHIGIGHCALGYPAVPLPSAQPRKADYIVRTGK